MQGSTPAHWRRRLLLVPAFALVVSACGAAITTPSGGSPGASFLPASASPAASAGASEDAGASPTAVESEPPGGGAAQGDIPDNAVFLTYHGTNPAFSIQYVEGWQVTQQPDGVIVRDKDSSETVSIVAPQSDVSEYVTSTDLPALQAQADFKLVKRDTVKVGKGAFVHLVYHLPAPPDPVTGKRVPSTVDRYYVPGANGLAIVSLSTPDGVDNVDAFRQMIGSFRWS